MEIFNNDFIPTENTQMTVVGNFLLGDLSNALINL